MTRNSRKTKKKNNNQFTSVQDQESSLLSKLLLAIIGADTREAWVQTLTAFCFIWQARFLELGVEPSEATGGLCDAIVEQTPPQGSIPLFDLLETDGKL